MNNSQPSEGIPSLTDLSETEPVVIAEKHRSPVVTFLIEMIQTLILAIVLYVMIDTVVARVRVENISMNPTLQAGEFLLVNKLAYKFSGMTRGDIVVFHYPPNPSEDYIKRLIGLPGDTVEIQNGTVKVNQQAITEPYIAAHPQYNGKWDVPQGSIFVLGDNRNQSSDSHAWGFVPLGNIVGKALVVYWPIHNVQVLTHPNIVNAANLDTP